MSGAIRKGNSMTFHEETHSYSGEPNEQQSKNAIFFFTNKLLAISRTCCDSNTEVELNKHAKLR